MTQEPDVDALVRQRIRSLRLARGWTLDSLAARCDLSPSNLSRIETGQRRIALDQLVSVARALGTTLDQLVEPGEEAGVLIRPEPVHTPGVTTWLLSRERFLNGVSVAKMRITGERPGGPDQLRVHPGHEWFTVLSGIAELHLGERVMLVRAGEAAEFSTMTPHLISAHKGPVEILTILDHDGERAHRHDSGKPGEHGEHGGSHGGGQGPPPSSPNPSPDTKSGARKPRRPKTSSPASSPASGPAQ